METDVSARQGSRRRLRDQCSRSFEEISNCAWAVRADLPQELADELGRLARAEPPAIDLRGDPVHAERYRALAGGELYAGPAFTFPEEIAPPPATLLVGPVQLLARYFPGWTSTEIAGRSPVVALMEDGDAVSVCFCARRSGAAAEAGLETAAAFRGRGLGPHVTAAWALGGARVWPRSALQYVVVQRRLFVGCTHIGSDSLCEHMEPVTIIRPAIEGILLSSLCPYLA